MKKNGTRVDKGNLKDWENSRSAGVLLSVTSLPSTFGIGDLGPEAYAFADFLANASQRYWQILPLNPIEESQGYSPYSSISAMAGNVLLISPELLLRDKLITKKDLERIKESEATKINFGEVETKKTALFNKAYQTFTSKQPGELTREFKSFVRDHQEWLSDFTLYITIKKHHQNKSWFEWPQELRLRDEQALRKFAQIHKEEIKKHQWLQYIFFRQWNALKKYANDRNVRFFGDLPFYVSYDSADVWANSEIFSLDKKGNMVGVAGVPPDYFNADGQLWGMPVFKWDVLKRRGYTWWIERLKRNMELFDLLRLDHFRAFANFWEVAAGASTARKGEWKPGPGQHFFNALIRQFGDMPFVAEDLGDINDEVYKLRDDFGLPGMVVLQFAFGKEMAQSVNIPHNYTRNSIAYTGTHDNNTTVGWFRKDATRLYKKNLSSYVDSTVKESNVHLHLIRLAYASVANTAIVPMQDILGLDENARMNTPAAPTGNWNWRLTKNQITGEIRENLKSLTELYNRDGKMPEDIVVQ